VAWRLLLIFCLLYIYELSNFNVTIDDELVAQSSVCQFADIGRWVSFLLRATLWPQVVVPSGPLLLFGCAFVVSFIYIVRLFGVVKFSLFHYVAFAAYALFPTWFAQLEFAGNVLPDAVGLLAAVFAALLTVDACRFSAARGWIGYIWRLAGAIVCCAVAIGAYQSLGLMYLALVVGAGVSACIQGSQPAWAALARNTARALLVLLLGFALSLAIGRMVMQTCHMAPAVYGMNILHFSKAIHHPLSALNLGVNEVRRLYYSFWHPFGRQASLIYAVTVLSCCGAIVSLAERGTRWRTSGALLVLLLIPAGLNIVGFDSLPVRTFFAGPVVFLFLLLTMYRLCRNQALRHVTLVLTLLCTIQGLYINSAQQARGWTAARHDLLLAEAINAEISRLQGNDTGGPIYVNFHGKRTLHSSYPALGSATTGASFFEWDGGSMSRMVAYMNLIGYDSLRAYPGDQPGEFDPEYAQMPAWPAPGSVKRFGKGYLVKLSSE
jgi:hypothetical protein